MAEKIDVLAAMDGFTTGYCENLDELRAARRAVAELIAAARAYRRSAYFDYEVEYRADYDERRRRDQARLDGALDAIAAAPKLAGGSE